MAKEYRIRIISKSLERAKTSLLERKNVEILKMYEFRKLSRNDLSIYEFHVLELE